MTKAPPPFSPAVYGKRQMLPSPIAEPADHDLGVRGAGEVLDTGCLSRDGCCSDILCHLHRVGGLGQVVQEGTRHRPAFQ